ncbi:MAG: Ig-like domain-containing protein [Oscillospiraceae bacterium]|nr:Ig-like domain-containing protein [Oscillospiraceae bacterium]
MGLFPQITCRHCGKTYSAIRMRCPHCGTRRVQSSERAPASTAAAQPGTAARARANAYTHWQFMFGVVLLVAVVVAVIILIVAGTGGTSSAPEPTPTVMETEAPAPTPTPTPTPTPEPTPTVTSITVSFLGSTLTEFSANVGDKVDLDATVYPLDTEAVVTWSSDDESICTVDQDGVVTGVGSGWATVTVACGSITTAVRVLIW